MAFTPTEWIWKNGEFIRWEDATIHIMSHVVHYGSSIFEGIRCYSTPAGPAIFRLPEHIRRFHDTARVYRMFDLPESAVLENACKALVARNGLDACYIRPLAIRGFGSPGMDPKDSPLETYVICWEWGAYLGSEGMAKGVDAGVGSWHRLQPDTIPAAAKAGGNYLNSQLLKMEAHANGYAEAIALAPSGLVSEGSGQNIFLVRDGELLTPEVDGTFLIGITRDSILTLARDMGLPVRETRIPREFLYTADEAFFCGTAAELTPIRSIDRIPVGDGKVGPVTQALQERFLAVARGQLPDLHGWLTAVGTEAVATV